MNTSSTIELFSSLFGWLMYDNIYGVLNTLGLTYIPFIGFTLRALVAGSKGKGGRSLEETAETWQYSMVVGLFAYALAVSPMQSVSMSDMNSTRPALICGGTANTVNGNATGTTYQNAFSTLGGQTAQVPAWWGFISQMSHGITAASVAGIPCSADLRQYQMDLAQTRITDPVLRKELSNFMKACYLPAVADIQNRGGGLIGAINRPSAADLGYMGSDALLNDPAYNKALSEPVNGWNYDATRDMGYGRPDGVVKDFGHPTCAQLWTATNDAGEPGLRDRLVASMPTELRDQAKSNTGSGLRQFFGGVSDQEVDETLLRSVLVGNEGASSGRLNNDYATSGTAGPTDIVGNVANSAAAAVGGGVTAMSHYPKMMMIREALPIAKAFLLMGIYALLPFVLVFSAYSLSAIGTASVAIFALTFMDFIWGMCFWMDNKMLAAINDGSIGGVLGYVWNPQTNMVLDFSIGILYLALPMLWLAMLSWAGIKVGNSLTQVSDAITRPAGAAGEAGGKLATKVITKGKG